MSSTNKHSLREILEAIIVLYTERKLGESRSVSIKTEERAVNVVAWKRAVNMLHKELPTTH